MGESLYSVKLCISKLVLIQHTLCTQVSDTGPLILCFLFFLFFVLFFFSYTNYMVGISHASFVLQFLKCACIFNLSIGGNIVILENAATIVF